MLWVGFLLLISLPCIALAQVTEEWVARYDGAGDGWSGDVASAIAVDNSGNVFVTGRSDGSGTEVDYATIKYNSAGVEQWVTRYNGPVNGDDKASAIAVDKSGNVYVTGVSVGSGMNVDYTTIKYDSLGAERWVARYNGMGNYADVAYSIAADKSGNVYVTGISYGGFSNYDYATIKYNSAGVEQWIARYNGPKNSIDGASSLALDNSGNIYVTGCSTAWNDSLDPNSSYDFDYATIMYNSAGLEQWVARYNGPGNDDDIAKRTSQLTTQAMFT